MTKSKTINLIPANDASRLEKLREYQVLDTHSEDTFDKIALLASQIFNTSSAFISLVDEDRVFFKSNLSTLNANEVSREDSLCSITILQDNVNIYNDTHSYEELMSSPYVATEGGIRFYAGIALKSPEGYNIGSLCVSDSTPRNQQVTQEQVEMLKTLASIVVDKLENRLRYRKSMEQQNNLMNMALHEIKNPLASINLANDIIRKDVTKADKMTDMIKSSVARIQNKLSDLLEQSEQEELMLAIEEIDLNEMFSRLITNFELLAQRKKQTVELHCAKNFPKLFADRVKISDVLHNLLSNAIKYSYPGSTIKIIAKTKKDRVFIEIKDEGQGLNDNDVSLLFTKFAKLSSKPTGKETSNGLGLSITKALVEMHNGTIEAVSEGKDKGTSFIVNLPLRYQTELQAVLTD